MGKIANDAAVAYRDYNVPGNPSSEAYEPDKPTIRTLFETVESRSARAVSVLGIVGSSWHWEDATNGVSAFEAAHLAALNARFGPGTWTAYNVSAGARGWTSLSGNRPTYGEQIATLVRAGMCSHAIIGEGGYNDINNVAPGAEAAGEALIKTAIQAGVAALVTAGIPYTIMNIPPLKGATPYSAARNTLRLTLNAWLASTYPGKIWNIAGAYATGGVGVADPADTDQILPSMAKPDKFHIFTFAKQEVAANYWATASVTPASDSASNLRVAKEIILDQSVTRQSTITTRHAIFGDDFGLVGTTNINPKWDDPRPHLWMGTRYFAADGTGHTLESALNGNMEVRRYAAGNQRLVLSLAALPTDVSALFGRLQVSGDGDTLTITGSTFGGGAGVGRIVSTDSSLGMRAKTVNGGGTAFGTMVEQMSSWKAEVAGSERFRIDANGIHTGNFGGTAAAGRIYFGTSEQASIRYDTAGFVFQGGGYMLPFSDNNTQLGGAGNRYTVLFAATGTINTSDATQKTPLEPLAEEYLLAALDTEQGGYRWLEAVEGKGDRARIHFGPTAQGFRDACFARGVNPNGLAAYCEDPEMARVQKTQKVTRQAKRTIEVQYEEIERVPGGVRKVIRKRTEEQYLTETLPVLDDDGNPVMRLVRPATPEHQTESGEVIAAQPDVYVPVTEILPLMEEVEETYEVQEPTGRTLYGLRLDQFDRILSEARWRVQRGTLKWEPEGSK